MSIQVTSELLTLFPGSREEGTPVPLGEEWIRHCLPSRCSWWLRPGPPWGNGLTVCSAMTGFPRNHHTGRGARTTPGARRCPSPLGGWRSGTQTSSKLKARPLPSETPLPESGPGCLPVKTSPCKSNDDGQAAPSTTVTGRYRGRGRERLAQRGFETTAALTDSAQALLSQAIKLNKKHSFFLFILIFFLY